MCLLNDGLCGYHHAEIDHFVAVALQYHANDVLADIMHVPFHRGHQDLTLGGRIIDSFLLDEGLQIGD